MKQLKKKLKGVTVAPASVANPDAVPMTSGGGGGGSGGVKVNANKNKKQKKLGGGGCGGGGGSSGVVSASVLAGRFTASASLGSTGSIARPLKVGKAAVMGIGRGGGGEDDDDDADDEDFDSDVDEELRGGGLVVAGPLTNSADGGEGTDEEEEVL